VSGGPCQEPYSEFMTFPSSSNAIRRPAVTPLCVPNCQAAPLPATPRMRRKPGYRRRLSCTCLRVTSMCPRMQRSSRLPSGEPRDAEAHSERSHRVLVTSRILPGWFFGQPSEMAERSDGQAGNRAVSQGQDPPTGYDAVRAAVAIRVCGRTKITYTIPSSALITTATMPTGIAIFQPMFMSWS